MDLIERITTAFNNQPTADDRLQRYRALLLKAHEKQTIPPRIAEEFARILLDSGLSALHLREHWRVLNENLSMDFIQLTPISVEIPWAQGFGENAGPKMMPHDLQYQVNEVYERMRMGRQAGLGTLAVTFGAMVESPDTATDGTIADLLALMASNKVLPQELPKAVERLQAGVAAEDCLTAVRIDIYKLVTDESERRRSEESQRKDAIRAEYRQTLANAVKTQVLDVVKLLNLMGELDVTNGILHDHIETLYRGMPPAMLDTPG